PRRLSAGAGRQRRRRGLARLSLLRQGHPDMGHDPARIEAELDLAVEHLGEASLDQPRTHAIFGRFRNLRPATLPPGERQPACWPALDLPIDAHRALLA